MSLRELGFGLLAGPMVWSAQFMAIYSIQAAGGCAAHLPGVELVMHLISLAAALVVGRAGWLAWRHARALEPGSAELIGPRGCLAQSGVYVSALFLLAIVLGDIPVFVLRPC
jgi:hypothetical protein